MPSPYLSILMGVYNAQKTLQSAINSILAQDFKDWEFIIIDDGSTDQSWMILQAYQHDSRFKIFKNSKNLGLAATLNLCLQKSNGQYIVRQDADDTSAPTRFVKQVETLKSRPEIDVLGTAAYLINDQGKIWGTLTYPPSPKMTEWVHRSQIIHPTVMIKSDLLKQLSGYDSTALRVEDYELWFRLMAKGAVFHNSQEPLYYFHWSDNDYRRKKFKDRLKEIEIRWKGFILNKVPFRYYGLVFKPLFVGLIPAYFLQIIHRYKFKSK